jgi:glutamyl-tRNA(Gln) amidotransferase subunit D
MDNVKLYLKDEVIEGLLVSEDEKHVVVKLQSGYNLGISKNRIEKTDVFQLTKVRDDSIIQKHTLSIHKSALAKVLILHTGGTIASKVDYKTGAVTARFSPYELLSMFPELKEVAHIESKLFRNMMSDDMRFSHYNLLAEEISKEFEADNSLKGIIITHGTDTMHYTAAALSFLFEHLPVPVVLVGSQRSSDRGSSDAAMNIISAAAFIANTSLSGVFICMHENSSDDSCVILSGLNCRKMHSSRRDAFKPVNSLPVARVDFATKRIDYSSEYPSTVLNSKGHIRLHKLDENLRIGIVVSHPNMHASELECFKDFDGLILEGTGLGHMPITEMDEFTKENSKIRSALSMLCKKMPVVMALQTIYGKVNMNVYSPGRDLIDMGVIGSGSALSIETAYIKLAWLLSQKLDPKIYFMQDLRGEMQGKEI